MEEIAFQIDLTEVLKVNTNNLTLDDLQMILSVLQRLKGKNGLQSTACIKEATQLLWSHLQNGLPTFDSQLLCSTCFYTMLIYNEQRNEYLNDISLLVDKNLEIIRHVPKISTDLSQPISIIYGMFQSSFLISMEEVEINLEDILRKILDFLTILAYQYSKYTFIVFKIIKSFRILVNTSFNFLLDEEIQIKLITLTVHNWENPVTGVRDVIKNIFQLMLTIINSSLFDRVLSEINMFDWHKGKYLMLAEIIATDKRHVIEILDENQSWIEGLLDSLAKPGLVSAGADMYYSILHKMRCEKEWCIVFVESVMKILSGKSFKAIENLTNYWLLVTLKKFPQLKKILTDKLAGTTYNADNLFSVICVLKQGNKLHLGKKFDLKCEDLKMRYIFAALSSCDPCIRLQAFEIICVLDNSFPSKLEFNLIYEFLYNNINSDSNTLRISLLKNIKIFLNKLFVLSCDKRKVNYNDNIENLEQFYILLQHFLVINLTFNGNYQRKITSIKLCDILLTSVKTTKTKKTYLRDKKEKNWIIRENNFITILVKQLKDPADDVRENTMKVLLSHYSDNLRSAEMMNMLIKDAFNCLKSKYFYEISCGHTIFKLITRMLKYEHTELPFNSINELFLYMKDDFITEYRLRKSIMQQIESGKQVHALITVLHNIIQVCLENFSVNTIISTFNEIVNLLHDISKQFVTETCDSMNSDFSKMSDIVQNIICTYGYNPYDKNDEAKISGLQQIVLNCMWLNVKACCELASIFIKCYTTDEQLENCEKSIYIIANVLETSRHKGAIEAAGTSLGLAIQHLTSLPNDVNLSMLPYDILKKKLTDWISEVNKMASITRRGAGLSIMVHRIVASDKRKDKKCSITIVRRFGA